MDLSCNHSKRKTVRTGKPQFFQNNLRKFIHLQISISRNMQINPVTQLLQEN